MFHFSLKPFNRKFMQLLCPPKTSRIQLGRSLIDDLRSTIFHWFAKTSWHHTQASLSAAGDRSTRWSAKTNENHVKSSLFFRAHQLNQLWPIRCNPVTKAPRRSLPHGQSASCALRAESARGSTSARWHQHQHQQHQVLGDGSKIQRGADWASWVSYPMDPKIWITLG